MKARIRAMASLHNVAPFFIVDDLESSLDFYCHKLGFEVVHKGGDGSGNVFWGMVRRDNVMIMLKSISPEIHPVPNCSRHEWAPWDAYVYTPDPDSLYEEYVAKSAPIHQALKDTHDGLRAFEILDNNGYVLCFGRPVELSPNPPV